MLAPLPLRWPMTNRNVSLAAPTPLANRALAPDLARGALLLFIAIANSPWYLWVATSRGLSGWPVNATALDRVVQTISLVAIDGRSYPMFAALFGYGIWQITARMRAEGIDPAASRRLLRRRHTWLLAFGAVHAALLWGGDVLGAYGLAGLAIGWLFLDRPDRTLRRWAIAFVGILSVGAVVLFAAGLVVLAAGEGEDGSYAAAEQGLGIATSSYPESIVERVRSWLVLAPVQGLAFAVPAMILLAILAARHRVLEQPELHRPLLRRTAIIGIAIGWTGGAITAAQNLDLFGIPSSLDWMFAPLTTVTGLGCGVGYLAAIGLLAARLSRPSRLATAVRALGSRSLTFYLAQSLFFAPIMSAWGLGLGAQLSSWSIVVVAIGVWAASLAVAALLDHRGIRGPAETLLRHLTYRHRQTYRHR